MDKLTMAHEYFLRIVSNPSVTLRAEDLQNIQHNAWVYADAMQAEADKRVKAQDKADAEQSKVVRETLQNSGKEWQPDWSVSPDWANWWCADKLGVHWFEYEPRYVGNIEWYDDGVGKYRLSPSFGYKGLWQESLRKRPE